MSYVNFVICKNGETFCNFLSECIHPSLSILILNLNTHKNSKQSWQRSKKLLKMKFSSNLGLLVALSPTIHLLVSAKTNSISNLPVTVDDIAGPNANAPPGSCLEYEGNCKYDQVRERVESYLNNVASSCDHGVDAELKVLLGVESEQDVEDAIASLCQDAWETIIQMDILGQT